MSNGFITKAPSAFVFHLHFRLARSQDSEAVICLTWGKTVVKLGQVEVDVHFSVRTVRTPMV